MMRLSLQGAEGLGAACANGEMFLQALGPDRTQTFGATDTSSSRCQVCPHIPDQTYLYNLEPKKKKKKHTFLVSLPPEELTWSNNISIVLPFLFSTTDGVRHKSDQVLLVPWLSNYCDFSALQFVILSEAVNK